MPIATTEQGLDAVRDFFAGCAGVDEAIIGQPLSLGPVNIVWVAVSDAPTVRDQFRQEWIQNYLAVWERAVGSVDGGSDEVAVERALATFKDDARTKWRAARKVSGGALEHARWDDTLASQPDYRPRSELPTRAYPLMIGLPMTAQLP